MKKMMMKSFVVLMMVGVLAMISFAQTTTKTNLYNVNGTKVEITTKNYVQTFYLMPSGELQFSNKTIGGTWLQYSTGTGETPFIFATGKNELLNRSRNLDVWTGTYNIETGKCTAIRLSDSAQNGVTGPCTITVVPAPPKP